MSPAHPPAIARAASLPEARSSPYKSSRSVNSSPSFRYMDDPSAWYSGFILMHSSRSGVDSTATKAVISFVVLALVYVLPEIIQNIVDFVNYIPTAYNTLMDLLIQLQERFPSLDLNGIIKPVSDTAGASAARHTGQSKPKINKAERIRFKLYHLKDRD